MEAGDLDQRITLQSVSSTTDAGGGRVETWATVATLWAMVRPLSGRERLETGQLESPSDYRITIRRRSDITTDKRIVWKGKNLNIRFDGFNSAREGYLTFDAEMGVPT